MALHWHIEASERLFFVVARGHIEAKEVESMLDVLVESSSISYRKLFNFMRSELRMTSSDLLPLSVRTSMIMDGDTLPAPVAFVLSHQKRPHLMRLISIMTDPKSPLGLFNDLESARTWLGLSRIWQR